MRNALTLALLLALPWTAAAYDVAQLREDMYERQKLMMTKLKDLTLEQEATFDIPDQGKSTAHSTVYRKDGRWRAEGSLRAPTPGAEAAESSTIQIFDGTETWSSSMGVKFRMPASQATLDKAAAFWAQPVDGATITGEEKVNGRDCWIVTMPEISTSPIPGVAPPRLWIDKKALLCVQSESPMAGHVVRAVFSDFRTLDGFEFPGRTELYTSGRITMTSRIVKLEANTGLSDDLFSVATLPGTELGVPGAAGGVPAADLEAIKAKTAELHKQMLEERKRQEEQQPKGQ